MILGGFLLKLNNNEKGVVSTLICPPGFPPIRPPALFRVIRFGSTRGQKAVLLGPSLSVKCSHPGSERGLRGDVRVQIGWTQNCAGPHEATQGVQMAGVCVRRHSLKEAEN